ncbi:DUF4259 domain-containing protein [Micromonospora sp. NPDC023956]|uniref:DUF4259 domain-containing protein n=1 Tax=Micromonospora sp. NPDC023956 TaxID=3155722 RepID=UPI003401343A
MGPFDNDGALDLCDELKEAGGSEAYGILQSSLAAAQEVGGDHYLEKEEAEAAIAAAAIVAARRVGNEVMLDEFGLGGVVPEHVNELANLAVGALLRVISAESELNEVWAETKEGDEWRAGVRSIVDVLRG